VSSGNSALASGKTLCGRRKNQIEIFSWGREKSRAEEKKFKFGGIIANIS
jgi:hypothetical protein